MSQSEAVVTVRISTAAGPLAVVGTEEGVREIYFERPEGRQRPSSGAPPPAGTEPQGIPGPVRDAVEQLQQYFQGERRDFDFKMALTGTEFQRRVWRELLHIPPGETRTYGQIARSLGNPKAARAVGGAVGSNPVSIAIPCHRVVGADGKGGGYGGGMAAKSRLLQLEGAWPEGTPPKIAKEGKETIR